MFGEMMDKDRGFALVVVIVVMLMISFLASQLILQVRTELKIATNRADHIAERMLAEGGINLALFRLFAEPDEEAEESLGGKFRHGKIYESVFPKGKIEYYAVNESGKINLNASVMEPLMLFLEHYGLDEDERNIVSDSLLDWRDGDDLYRLNGAEKDFYEELERPYLPRNGTIGDPGEFFMIRGTESLKGKFDPYEVFTVHNQDNKGRIYFNSLTPAMLDFLTLGDQESKDLYWELKEDVINLSAVHAQQVLGVERYTLFSKYLTYNFRNNTYYSLVAVGSVGNMSDEDMVDQADEDLPEEQSVKKKKGVKVSALVSSNGRKIKFMSWRISYT